MGYLDDNMEGQLQEQHSANCICKFMCLFLFNLFINTLQH